MGVPARGSWPPYESLRNIDRVFDAFDGGTGTSFGRSTFDVEAFVRREVEWAAAPAVDVGEKDKSYEITAELPSMTEKDIEVTLANGTLSIKGEKQEEKEEKKTDYYKSVHK